MGLNSQLCYQLFNHEASGACLNDMKLIAAHHPES